MDLWWLGALLAIAPVLVRSVAQGLRVGSVATAAVLLASLWLAQRLRWPWAAAVGATAVLAAAVLRPSFGLAVAAFGAAGLVAGGWTWSAAGERPPALSARAVAATSWVAGTAVVWATPRVTAAAVIPLAGAALAVLLDRRPPASLESLVAGPGAGVQTRAAAVHGALGRAWVAVREQVVGTWHAATVGVRPTDPRLLGLVALALGLGVLLAVRDQRLVLFDDAAITFRYADRIAGGEGFTYNPGDRTNGASAPLYTLVLAVGHRLGADLEAMARVIGVIAYAATAGLVAHIAGRLRGLLPAALGATLLLASTAYRGEALNGMESVFAAALGLGVVALLVADRRTLAGVVLGLAVVNKLDAGLLAVAAAGALLLVDRRPPWRVAGVATLVAAPWFLFSTVYFGSPVPHSATQKLGEEVLANTTTSYDRLWIARTLANDGQGFLIAIAVLAVLVTAAVCVTRPPRLDRGLSVAVLVAGGWFVLHGVAFSVVDLGDTYPWYTTVLYPPLVLAAVLGLFLPWRQLAPSVAVPTVVTAAVVLAVAAVLLRFHGDGIRRTAEVVQTGHVVGGFELFEKTRQDAGRLVGERAEPGDVLTTCYGWPAYEAPQTVIDELCPLSTRDDVGDPTWWVMSELGGGVIIRPIEAHPVVTFHAQDGSTRVFRDYDR